MLFFFFKKNIKNVLLILRIFFLNRCLVLIMKKSIIFLVFCIIIYFLDLYYNRYLNIVDFIGNVKGIYILRKFLIKCDIKDVCV